MAKQKREPKTLNKLTAGLFNRPFSRLWLKFTIKDIGIMFSRIRFVFRHGYFPAALYNTDIYFSDMFEEILQWHMDYAMGYPSKFESKADWNKILNRMRELNSVLNMDYIDYTKKTGATFNSDESRKFYKDREIQQKEFFNLFCEYFHDLWD